MADSIPSLRRVVNELRAKIRELESRPADVVVNEVVRIVETRPLSKDKHWRVVNIVEQAQ